ncbi:MAG: enoyl-CoA hydratase/isomerase family protein [Sagittula sp.]|uniref:enoyl-CoA hydratase/isomerase family protein n=1 Tax=Sagittula sp. TaxID=2038081 RepID=UPI004058F0DA
MTDLPTFDHVGLTLTDAVLRITLNRPDKLNAINPVLHREIAEAFDFACTTDAARVVVLTGAGRAFSAGGDMSDVSETVDSFAREAEFGRRIVQRMLDCDKPILCRLNGDAIGLGATLVLLSDIVVGVDSARIADPHVRMGLVAGDGGALVWPAHAGMMAAKYYLLTGDMMTAAEAQALGLITFAVPADELDARCDKILAKLVNGAPLAIKWTKRALNTALQQAAPAVFDMSLAAEGLTIVSEDHAEARAAFLEKRKPVFTGR